MLQKESEFKNGHPRFYEILKDLALLHERKNTDYAAGGVQGPLGNFERCATIMSLYPGMEWGTRIGVALAYMLKQLDAALMLLSQKRNSVTGEGVPERLKDVATYSVIGMVISEEESCNAAVLRKAENPTRFDLSHLRSLVRELEAMQKKP